MEYIIGLLIGLALFKIIQWMFRALSSLFSSNSSETTNSDSDESNSSKTTNSNSDEDKEPPLKYDNPVYKTFRKKVYNTYKAMKEEGYPLRWLPESDTFVYFVDDSLSEGSAMYSVGVQFDKEKNYISEDPYYILISYGIFLKGSEFDRYNNMTMLLNKYINYELNRPQICYAISNVENGDFILHSCSFIIFDNQFLDEQAQILGEVEMFKQLLHDSRVTYNRTIEDYKAKYKDF